MQHTTLGNTTTFYSTTEESRIDKTVSALNIRFLVKFTNDFTKNSKYAYAQKQNINNRYTSFDIIHNSTEDILTGNINLSPEGYWTYEIYEISFVGTPSLTDSTVPLDENTVLAPSDDNGVNNGRIEIGQLLSSATDLSQEVQYSEYATVEGDSYLYPSTDTTDSSIVSGCTNINANNYNANATIDDGSCTFNIYGCTDSNANNYDSNATIDDGSCTFDVSGCIDNTAANYNANATVDDGSCTYIVYGCTDSNANNYDPTATNDNGSCTYTISGCTDNTADNYNPNADIDDGSCTYPAVFENLKSLSFDGATNYLQVPKSSDFKTPLVSVFVWVKFPDWNISGVFGFISTFRSGGGWKITYNNKRLETAIRIGSSTKTFQSGFNKFKSGNTYHTANNWHHIGMTFDGEFIKLYVDGALESTGSNAGVIDLGSTGNTINYNTGINDIDMFIGSDQAGNDKFSGIHDDACTWNSALSGSEVTALYNNGLVTDPTVDAGNYVSSSNLSGWWRLGDGDTIPTITDNSTNSNDGTTVNMSSSDVSTDVPS